jgi:hypothetical protein
MSSAATPTNTQDKEETTAGENTPKAKDTQPDAVSLHDSEPGRSRGPRIQRPSSQSSKPEQLPFKDVFLCHIVKLDSADVAIEAMHAIGNAFGYASLGM